jgi:hypothetical protein
MLWVTLTRIGIKSEKGLGTHELHSASKVFALKLLQPACLCLGLFRGLKKPGLGEPFGKASLANTAFRSGGFISMRNRSSCTVEGRHRYPSKVWPDEVLERGLPWPLAKRRKIRESKSIKNTLTKD